jgi:hypothetical protein
MYFQFDNFQNIVVLMGHLGDLCNNTTPFKEPFLACRDVLLCKSEDSECKKNDRIGELKISTRSHLHCAFRTDNPVVEAL